jgi:hypothetical protein
MNKGDAVTVNTQHGIGKGTVHTVATAKGGKHFAQIKAPTGYGHTLVNIYLDPEDEGKTWAAGDDEAALDSVQAHLAGKALSGR